VRSWETFHKAACVSCSSKSGLHLRNRNSCCLITVLTPRGGSVSLPLCHPVAHTHSCSVRFPADAPGPCRGAEWDRHSPAQVAKMSYPALHRQPTCRAGERKKRICFCAVETRSELRHETQPTGQIRSALNLGLLDGRGGSTQGWECSCKSALLSLFVLLCRYSQRQPKDV